MNARPVIFNLVAGLVACLLLAGALVGHHSLRAKRAADFWPSWVGPAGMLTPAPSFFDLEVVLWGVERHERGHEVYSEATAGELPFLYNYPSAWLALGWFGLNVSDTLPLATILVSAFLVAVLGVLRPRNLAATVWAVLALLSPPVLDVVGMANTDAVIFILIVLALAWNSRGGAGVFGATAIFVGAAMLKLFPVAGLPALLDRRRRSLLAVTLGLGASSLWFAVHTSELAMISRNTPRPHASALGSLVLAARLDQAAGRHPKFEQTVRELSGGADVHRTFRWLSIFAFAALAVSMAAVGARRLPTPSRPLAFEDAPDRLFFRCGALLYLGTFALGNSWSHREIFLFLLIPACFHPPSEARAPGSCRALAWLVLAVFWCTAISNLPVFLVGQALSWVLVGWLARSLGSDYMALRPWSVIVASPPAVQCT